MMSCDQHDTVEIACMYNYPVKLICKSGSELQGVARDTGLDKFRQECIKIMVENRECLVVLNTVAKMEVLVKNPHFNVVDFD